MALLSQYLLIAICAQQQILHKHIYTVAHTHMPTHSDIHTCRHREIRKPLPLLFVDMINQKTDYFEEYQKFAH